MKRNHDNSKKDCVTTSGFKSSQGDDRGNANEYNDTGPGATLAGFPGHSKYESNLLYHEQRHSCFASVAEGQDDG